MVGSTGVRRGLINPGDRSDGLKRKGSNPLPTTKFIRADSDNGSTPRLHRGGRGSIPRRSTNNATVADVVIAAA
jgi:hypothetical protein